MKEKSCFSYKFVNDVCVVGGVQEPDDEDDGEPFFSADVILFSFPFLLSNSQIKT